MINSYDCSCTFLCYVGHVFWGSMIFVQRKGFILVKCVCSQWERSQDLGTWHPWLHFGPTPHYLPVPGKWPCSLGSQFSFSYDKDPLLAELPGKLPLASPVAQMVKNLPKIWETQVQASLIAQLVKNLPAMQETAVWFLGQEDELEKG